eukprot:1869564-Amphidinium_carterae.1
MLPPVSALHCSLQCLVSSTPRAAVARGAVSASLRQHGDVLSDHLLRETRCSWPVSVSHVLLVCVCVCVCVGMVASRTCQLDRGPHYSYQQEPHSAPKI